MVFHKALYWNLSFLLYKNDLPNISSKLSFFLFAGDTNIFFECSNVDDTEKTVNKKLKKLNVWLNVNRLALNISKTNFVSFSPVNKPVKNVTILINKHPISQNDYVMAYSKIRPGLLVLRSKN